MTANNQTAKPTVVVIGGGYGGVTVAKALDETSDVVLVEPRDVFMHNIAALRALVDPSYLPRIFMPYTGLLANGRVIRDRAVAVDPHRVVTASGQEIAADYIVLASGSSYPFPAKTDLVDTFRAQDQVCQTHQALSQADRVLLVGAGPVGIELAGEIREVWPEKSIVLLDVADEVLSGPFVPELKAELRRQLIESKVELVLGSPLQEAPTTAPGELGTFTVTTKAGTEITADIWFRCHGVMPNSDYLGAELASARRPDGFIEVEPTCRWPARQLSSHSVISQTPTARWPVSHGVRPPSWRTTSTPWPRGAPTSPCTSHRALPSRFPSGVLEGPASSPGRMRSSDLRRSRS